MKLNDLEKYIGHYISFDYATFVPPWKTDNMDCNNHIEGVLKKNDGRLSHFAVGDSALRDDLVGLIINFVDKGESQR